MHKLMSQRIINFLVQSCGFINTGEQVEVIHHSFRCADGYYDYDTHRTMTIVKRPSGMSRTRANQIISCTMAAFKLADKAPRDSRTFGMSMGVLDDMIFLSGGDVLAAKAARTLAVERRKKECSPQTFTRHHLNRY